MGSRDQKHQAAVIAEQGRQLWYNVRSQCCRKLFGCSEESSFIQTFGRDSAVLTGSSLPERERAFCPLYM